jgi:outer membrane protein assembly factor BamB
MDLPNIPYESKNILWMTELPHRSNATPIVVGDRLFVMAEPDELLCLDAKTGRVLWSAANNFYEALTPEERRAKPAYHDKVDPLIVDLKKEKDFVKRVGLRGKIRQELLAIDAERFAFQADGHFQDHFGIVGFTTPTPVSDGKHVWVWCGNGVAACYDLDGKRRWVTRLEAGPLSYSSSPALVDGTLAVFLNKLFGLDAATGKLRWEQPLVRGNNGSLLPGRLAGVPVVVTETGTVVRVSDGKVLFRDRNHAATWAPGVVSGDLLYLPNYGVSELQVLDFKGATGDDWKPKKENTSLPEEIHRGEGGKWIDRMTAGCPLVHDGLAYEVDIFASFYAIDLKARKMLYRQETDLRGLFHYNSLPVAASPTLLGQHIVILDNQGTALVLKPGRTFQQVARNRIATQLDRPWPIPAQETIAYGPPVADGNRFYLRGERYLYCIGEK